MLVELKKAHVSLPNRNVKKRTKSFSIIKHAALMVSGPII